MTRSVFGDIEPADDLDELAWITTTLHPFAVDVGSLIPAAFDRYLRIEHPTPKYPFLPGDLVARIAEVGIEHTTTPGQAWFALWEGWMGGGFRADPARDLHELVEWEYDLARKAELAAELVYVPRWELPGRTYYVYTGSVAAVSTLTEPIHHLSDYTADKWWPADCAWCVASDVDLSWTYVGGSAGLIKALTARLPEVTRAVEITDPIR